MLEVYPWNAPAVEIVNTLVGNIQIQVERGLGLPRQQVVSQKATRHLIFPMLSFDILHLFLLPLVYVHVFKMFDNLCLDKSLGPT